MHIHKTLTFKIIYKCIIVWIYMRSEKKSNLMDASNVFLLSLTREIWTEESQNEMGTLPTRDFLLISLNTITAIDEHKSYCACLLTLFKRRQTRFTYKMITNVTYVQTWSLQLWLHTTIFKLNSVTLNDLQS